MVPDIRTFFEFSSFSGTPKKVLHKLQNLKNGSAIGYRSARLFFFTEHLKLSSYNDQKVKNE